MSDVQNNGLRSGRIDSNLNICKVAKCQDLANNSQDPCNIAVSGNACEGEHTDAAGYTCSCAAGFKLGTNGASEQVCENVDDCSPSFERALEGQQCAAGKEITDEKVCKFLAAEAYKCPSPSGHNPGYCCDESSCTCEDTALACHNGCANPNVCDKICACYNTQVYASASKPQGCFWDGNENKVNFNPGSGSQFSGDGYGGICYGAVSEGHNCKGSGDSGGHCVDGVNAHTCVCSILLFLIIMLVSNRKKSNSNCEIYNSIIN